MKGYNNYFRFISLFVILTLLSFMMASCGGGGGGTSSDDVKTLENTVKTKAQAILPQNEYSIFESKLQSVQNDPDYKNYLNAINTALDNLNKAFQGYWSLKESQKQTFNKNSKTRRSVLKMSSSISGDSLPQVIEQINAIFTTMYGDISNNLNTARKDFLNAGTGYSKGKMFDIGGSIEFAAGIGYQITLNSGKGSEDVYSFINFEYAPFLSSECTTGVGITIGITIGVSCELGGTVEGVIYENWINGFKESVNDYTGPAIGEGLISDLEGKFLGGLGVSGNLGKWYGREGVCEPLIDLEVCPDIGSEKSSMNGFSVAIGVSGGGGFCILPGFPEVDINASLSKSNSFSCVKPSTDPIRFLDKYKNFRKEIKYLLAGFEMASYMLGSASPSNPPGLFELPAAATAILYGLLYDESLINPVDTTKPTVSIISPANNSTVPQGNISIQVSASDDIGISKIQVWTLDASYSDNKLFTGNNNSETATFTWNTSNYQDGSSQTLYARAYDTSGNYSDTYINVTIGTSVGYTISGKVTDSSIGSGLSGVTVTLTGTGSTTTSTDSNGNYAFTGAQNGNYTITPLMTNYMFNPSNRIVTVDNADVPGQDFVGTFSSSDGLIAYYSFDNCNANDDSGNNHNGTLVGIDQSKCVDGVEGKAFNFSNLDDHVEIPNDTALSLGGEYSISFWINLSGWSYGWPITFNGQNAGDGGWIISKWKAHNNNNRWGINIIRNSDYSLSRLRVCVANSGIYSEMFSNQNILRNNLYHIVVTSSASANKSAIYINGELDISTGFLGVPGINSHPLWIAAHYGISDRQIDGLVDEVRIYNRVLSQEEIAVLAHK